MPDHPPSSIFHPRRLLVRGVNWLGDAVMTTPGIATAPRGAARRAHHPAHAGEAGPAVAATPEPGCGSAVSAQERVRGPVARRLRAEGFDTALVLPNSPRSALEVWLARIPQRIGYAAPWRNWFLTRAVPARPGQRRMHKRSVGEIKRLIGRTAGHPGLAEPGAIPFPALKATLSPRIVRGVPPAQQFQGWRHGPLTCQPIKSTSTSIWQPRWARIPNPSRRGWKSPPPRCKKPNRPCSQTCAARAKPLTLSGAESRRRIRPRQALARGELRRGRARRLEPRWELSLARIWAARAMRASAPILPGWPAVAWSTWPGRPRCANSWRCCNSAASCSPTTPGRCMLPPPSARRWWSPLAAPRPS